MEQVKIKQKELSQAEHKGRAYFDIIEGIRKEYNLGQIDICKILKIQDGRYSEWKKHGRIPSFSSDTQPGINVIELARLYNKLSSFFTTTEGAITWLHEPDDFVFRNRSPLSILESEANGLFLMNKFLETRMNP